MARAVLTGITGLTGLTGKDGAYLAELQGPGGVRPESTLLWPRSPYGVAKVVGHSMTVNYRESYAMHASSGILFNHESPRRGHEFVTRKVSEAVARICLGLQDELTMGRGRQARLGFCRRLCRSHVAHAAAGPGRRLRLVADLRPDELQPCRDQLRGVLMSGAEICGHAAASPQDESTPVRPVSPHGAAKSYAHDMADPYRGRGPHLATCTFFSHESPRRPLTFVILKATAAAARIGAEGSGVIRLGNLDARRDGGWAPACVDAIVRDVRNEHAGDYEVATGDARTVAEFAEAALPRAGLRDSWRDHIEVDAELLRPAEALTIAGDAGKARRELGWEPTVRFRELVARMVDHNIELLQRSRE
jgi:GDP-D-mannose dehydratase